jgi:antitoxin component HigA of HigAB toxin-antitoxin module
MKPIENDEQYKQALKRLYEFIDEEDEDNELAELSELIYQYEVKNRPLENLAKQ